jgi:transposase
MIAAAVSQPDEDKNWERKFFYPVDTRLNGRFAGPGNFASYCRAVEAKRTSNQKKKGENNSKCGNKYLAWAFVEAANFAKRYEEPCRKWYDRKAAKTSPVIATKALACKLAKAAWYLMSEGTDYDAKRMFGQPATTK